mmetsp:Transcript_75945/g.180580  ORF Transcript_75945/g.180580 Transcript_75945/m.180580 type:complete len:873 (+) Transcript_75945:91-2709(+)|eukprot:CAMPEP_0178444378 /NCGR_PEP_ID=MMETSP0689_2-20121128/39459_1 /TAXON_ID=160604 /ORGANISM="Amphidinium massartii, Strain CS-259" /LENGTH=872 /DNA_ID=CAMNT_0020068573 /DNA_START=1 /DNA_END=2619 /DNA_ORIENTATION=-
MELRYHSGWPQAYLHYRKDDEKSWTDPPGKPMDKSADGTWSMKLEAKSLEFVCNNGSNDWDKPRQGGNYRVQGAGGYELKAGMISTFQVVEESRPTAAPTVTRSSSSSKLTAPEPFQSKASMFRAMSKSILGPVEETTNGDAMTRTASGNRLSRGPSGMLLDTPLAAKQGPIKLTYFSGWPKPFIHCCKDGGTWTTPPGLPWTVEGSGRFSLEVQAAKLEFVCNDGGSGWDKAATGGNYVIDTPGEYTIKNGRIKRTLPPPLPPRLAVVNAVGPSSVELAWNPPDDEDGMTGYRIYQEAEKVAETNVTTRVVTVSGLKGATDYTFKVTSVNEDGLESPATEVQAKTGQPGKPGPPSFLHVTSYGTDHVELAWSPPKDIGGASVTAYHIFRDGLAVDTVIAKDVETGDNLKSLVWKDTDVEAGAKYRYTISAMHMPDRTASQADLRALLEKRASHSLLEVPEEDNEGPSCEEVQAAAVVPLKMPKLGEQVTHVILQGFNWWSCENKNGWYKVLKEKVPDFKNAGFDMVWLPPPAKCVDKRGYLPSVWYDLNSYYGSQEDLIALGHALTEAGIAPMMDTVINHRCASKQDSKGKYTVFEKPDWGAWAICRNDNSGVGEGAMSTGELLEYAPDIDHTNKKIQDDVKAWIKWIFEEVGFCTLRLDFVIGFSPSFQEQYVRAAGSPFTVSEYWHGDPQVLRNYINASKGAIAVFDFPVYYTLKNCVRSNDFGGLNWGGKPCGIMGMDPVRSCTFVENHDTDHLEVVGGPFGDNNQIVRGYVYILTHPGTPTVFWSDWSDRGKHVQEQIDKVVQIRFAKGLHCLSKCSIAVSEGGLYAAYVDGKSGGIAMKLGNRDWKPNGNFKAAAWGDGYCVWTRD